MTEWKLHEELRGQTWENYGTDIVQDYEKMLQAIVPKYAFIKRKMKIGEGGEDQLKEKDEDDDEEADE